MKHRKWAYTTVTISIMILIWWFSNANGSLSRSQSGFFSRLLYWMNPDQASFLIRKTAHFAIYLFLGVFMNLTLREWRIRKQSRRMFLVIILCFLYAAVDELHQTIIPGRCGQISDVILDTAGSLTGLLFYTVFHGACSEPAEEAK